MVWWLFKKKGDNQVDPEAIKNSFSNIKHDMNHISSWINHFKSKHEEHKTSHQELVERIEKLESLLATKQVVEEIVETEELVTDLPKSSPLEDISLAERRVCAILNSLQNENGENWVSMKKLAEESYPEKEYRDSRSHISQLVTKLELDGFITKKKVGKYVYVYLNKEKKSLFEQQKVKAKTKKKKTKSRQKGS
jgi:hypothetical protein